MELFDGFKQAAGVLAAHYTMLAEREIDPAAQAIKAAFVSATDALVTGLHNRLQQLEAALGVDKAPPPPAPLVAVEGNTGASTIAGAAESAS